MDYKVAIIGTGADPESPDTDGFAMAYRHANAYQRLNDCQLVACADIVRENAEQFAARFDLPSSNVYEDYKTMLDEVRPDIVSVCVPPAIHSEIVIGCAESGVPQAIHCEKPMAATWKECTEMVRVCEEKDVRLTFNHQRRFAGPFRNAKALLEEGAIGSLQRLELGGENLYDYGTHLFDLCGYFTDQAQPKWVLGQIHYAEEDIRFGTHNENQALAQWQYENGVYGLASTGHGSLLNCQMRLIGTDGVIEIGHEDGPNLRMRSSATNGWKTVDTDNDTIHESKNSTLDKVRLVLERVPYVPIEQLLKDNPSFIDRAIENVVKSLDSDQQSPLAAENALQSTELIFACWESARRRQRIDLPLDIESNPLEEMVKANDVLVSRTD